MESANVDIYLLQHYFSTSKATQSDNPEFNRSKYFCSVYSKACAIAFHITSSKQRCFFQQQQPETHQVLRLLGKPKKNWYLFSIDFAAVTQMEHEQNGKDTAIIGVTLLGCLGIGDENKPINDVRRVTSVSETGIQFASLALWFP